MPGFPEFRPIFIHLIPDRFAAKIDHADVFSVFLFVRWIYVSVVVLDGVIYHFFGIIIDWVLKLASHRVV